MPYAAWPRSDTPEPLTVWQATASTGLGKQTLGGHKQNLVCTRPRRNKQWPHKRLTQTCLWVFRALWWRHGVTVACCRGRDTEYNSVWTRLLEGGCHYLHYHYHSLVSGQTGRKHSPVNQRKIGLKINWVWPCPSEQDPVSPTVSLSHQESSISLLSEGRQNENHNHITLIKLITWTTVLFNSMKLWVMPCSPTQDGQVMVESSGKM